MEGFAALDRTLRRTSLVALGSCTTLALLAASSVAYSLHVATQTRNSAQRMAVLVVPGAVAGIYTPGITEDSVRSVARYLAGLATNYSGARSFDERFDELESYFAPQLLPRLEEARRSLHRDLESQGQSRSFIASAASEGFQQDVPGHFRYSVRGERTVYSGGLAMTTSKSEVRLRLALGTPSDRNRLGIVIEGFDVLDVDGSGHTRPTVARGS